MYYQNQKVKDFKVFNYKTHFILHFKYYKLKSYQRRISETRV